MVGASCLVSHGARPAERWRPVTTSSDSPIPERPGERYFIGSDCSSHRYLVPLRYAAEWDVWADIPEDDERAWTVPVWAQRLEGGRLSFESPRMEERP